MRKFFLGGVAAVATLLSGSAFAADLVINADTSNPAPRAAITALVDSFRAANPDMDVELNISDREAYKTEIRNFLRAEEGPDLGFWYAGERMAGFVENGLFEDVSDVWADAGLNDAMASTRASITFDDKQYAVPYSYYQWGLYFRSDLLEAAGVTEMNTFDDLVNACGALRANGVIPVTIGTKFLWTAAGWFDYLNLRTNGLEYHIDLMLGKIPYTDDGVKATFANWKKLVDAECFIENHASYSWQEAQPFLYNGEAAMYLIGNFIVPNFPEDVKDKMDFMQFPSIDSSIGMYEDAPTDLLFVPANAKNKDNAKKFLAFLAQPENQGTLNEALTQIPPHSGAAAADDRFLQKGLEMLNSADGTAQFFDRDTDPEMAKIGMEGFQEFMNKPERVDAILKRMEAARKRIFK